MAKVTIERGIAFFEDGTEVSDVSVDLIKEAPRLKKEINRLKLLLAGIDPDNITKVIIEWDHGPTPMSTVVTKKET